MAEPGQERMPWFPVRQSLLNTMFHLNKESFSPTTERFIKDAARSLLIPEAVTCLVRSAVADIRWGSLRNGADTAAFN